MDEEGQIGDTGRAAGFAFAGETVAPGSAAAFDLPVSLSSANHPVTLPVRILHGARPGPVLFVSAAVHGDEITGVEIVRRLLSRVTPGRLAGTLLCVPIVNVFGFVANARYLPDRRDLNRSFPGSRNGALASRLAWLFRSEIIDRADFGIDLHSAAIHRTNLPQIRISPDSPRAEQMAEAFAAPATIVSPLRDKSLRATALAAGVEMLLYEAGEALRFDDFSVRTGVNGILRVMHAMGMLALRPRKKPVAPSIRATRSLWVRAPRGGICLLEAEAGDIVNPGGLLGRIANPVGKEAEAVISPIGGIIIGHSRHGVVNEGDALFHIAEIAGHEAPAGTLEADLEARMSGAMLDEDELL